MLIPTTHHSRVCISFKLLAASVVFTKSPALRRE
jgi:hypothetical protein